MFLGSGGRLSIEAVDRHEKHALAMRAAARAGTKHKTVLKNRTSITILHKGEGVKYLELVESLSSISGRGLGGHTGIA